MAWIVPVGRTLPRMLIFPEGAVDSRNAERRVQPTLLVQACWDVTQVSEIALAWIGIKTNSPALLRRRISQSIRSYCAALAPACETTSSCEPVPPDTPMAPMIFPLTMIGLPPREAITSSSVAR